MIDVPKIFGIDVFNDEVMQTYLPKDIYESLKRKRVLPFQII